MKKNEIEKYQKKLKMEKPQKVIAWAIDHFGKNNIAFSSSMGAEDQVLTDMLVKIDPEINIFTLDTGRLPEETYETIKKTERYYNKNIEILFPESSDIEEIVNKYGPNLFYESIDKRRLCCQARKVKPLRRKLSSLNAWICGLRQEQALTRNHIEVIEWDENFEVIKINPIVGWSEKDVWDYIHKNKIPYNKLHDQNYPSIGCAPCTRAIKIGENTRAGRWWWEEPEQKECGLHNQNNSLVKNMLN